MMGWEYWIWRQRYLCSVFDFFFFGTGYLRCSRGYVPFGYCSIGPKNSIRDVVIPTSSDAEYLVEIWPRAQGLILICLIDVEILLQHRLIWVSFAYFTWPIIWQSYGQFYCSRPVTDPG